MVFLIKLINKHMIVSEFLEKVRILTRANEADFPDDEIFSLADIEADALYEMSIQAFHLEQTANQQPTVITGIVDDSFFETDDNLWIERVEYSRNDDEHYIQLKRTNKTEYESKGCSCGTGYYNGSLTYDMESSQYCANYYIQTSQGIHVYPRPNDTGRVRIYVKDSPVINWGDPNAKILIPNVSANLLAIATALMYRDIENNNEYDKLRGKYNQYLELYRKRLSTGSRGIKMKVVSTNFKESESLKNKYFGGNFGYHGRQGYYRRY